MAQDKEDREECLRVAKDRTKAEIINMKFTANAKFDKLYKELEFLMPDILPKNKDNSKDDKANIFKNLKTAFKKRKKDIPQDKPLTELQKTTLDSLKRQIDKLSVDYDAIKKAEKNIAVSKAKTFKKKIESLSPITVGKKIFSQKHKGRQK